MENITLRISKKLKQELVQIAHQKGMVLNEYLNILLVNKYSKIQLTDFSFSPYPLNQSI
jgi:hypothetical protein